MPKKKKTKNPAQNIVLLALIITATLFFTLWTENKAVPFGTFKKKQTNEHNFPHAPDFVFTAIDNKTGSLKEYEGKIVLLNFWASWCAPCIEEFPRLIEIAQNFKGDVVLLAVSSDIEEKPIREFLKRFSDKIGKSDIIIVHDRDFSITQDIFQTVRLPETLIIDQNQRIREKIAGAAWTYEDMVKLIEEILP